MKQTQYNIGSKITFQLMKRERGSNVTIPVSEVTSRTSNALLRVSENQHTTVYSKLLLANYENVISILNYPENVLIEKNTNRSLLYRS